MNSDDDQINKLSSIGIFAIKPDLRETRAAVELLVVTFENESNISVFRKQKILQIRAVGTSQVQWSVG